MQDGRCGSGSSAAATSATSICKNAARFPEFEVVACADAVPERARERAAEYGVPAVRTVAELLADPAIEIVLNLTTPDAHAAIAQAALEAGKWVYNEKPLAIALEDGARLVETARGARLAGRRRAGHLPRRRVADLPPADRRRRHRRAGGGDGVHAHPRPRAAGTRTPTSTTRRGGGPLFDMGPYYLTALVSLLGPVRRVTGSARATFPERTIRSEPRAGERIAVEVPTHLAAVLDFASGAIGRW